MDITLAIVFILMMLAFSTLFYPEVEEAKVIMDNDTSDPVLEDMADDIREAFPKLVPFIQGPNLLVIHKERGVIISLSKEDVSRAVARVLEVYQT